MIALSIIWDVDPEIFNIFGFSIRWYSLMFVASFLIGIQLIKKMFKRDNISEDKIDPLFMYIFIPMILGMRLGEVFFYSWDYYQNHLLEIILPFKETAEGWKFTGFSGLASHGAAIAIPVALYFYSKKHLGKSWLFILDRVGVVAILAAFFIRIGNLFNSEIYGKVTEASFGFIFKRANETLPRHPTQIYEAISYLSLFALLYFIYWKTEKRKQEGFISGVLLIVLWTLRLLIEYLKEPQVVGREDIILGFNTGQLLSVPLILVGIWLIFRINKKQVETN